MNKTMPESEVGNCYSTQCGRITGKSMLKEVIDRLNQKAESLQIVYNMLPEQPTPNQDEAIWKLACKLRD